MGCGASKASVQPEPAAAKYISEPAPEKFTPPSRVAADEPLTSSFKKKATPAAAASPDASPSKKRATFDLPAAPTLSPLVSLSRTLFPGGQLWRRLAR